MQGQQESEPEDTQEIASKMAAAAVYQAPIPAHDTTSALNQHGFLGDQNQGFPFGEMNYLNWEEFESHIPSDQEPILNPTDEHMLAGFFSDPNSTTQSLIPYDVGFAGVQTNQFSGSHDKMQQSQLHMNGFPAHQGAMTNHQGLSADVYNAAQAINGFKASATWGNFAMPTPPNNTAMSNIHQPQMGGSRHMSIPNNRPQFIATAQDSAVPFAHPSYQAHVASLNQAQYHQQAQNYAMSAQHHRHSLGGQNYLSMHHHSQPAYNYQASQSGSRGDSRPHEVVRFGSDDKFTESGHQGQPDIQADQESKSRNLLGLGLASAAAQGSGQLPQQLSMRGRQSAVQAPSQNGYSNPFGYTTSGDDFPDGRDRKRRKSQAEGETAWSPGPAGVTHSGRGSSRPSKAEDSDDDSGKSAKRTKYTGEYTTQYQRPSGVPKSPTNRHRNSMTGEDDGSSGGRGGSKKPRETLSEQQKREHHIESEKKRREIINRGYSDLNTLVPCLNGGKSGLSRAECLQEVASYIETLVGATDEIMQELGLTNRDLSGPSSQPSVDPALPPQVDPSANT